MHTYEPEAGTHIKKACDEAASMASRLNDEVVFSFNGIAMRAQPSDKVETLVNRWQSIQDEQQRTYQESPEGQRAKADRAATITKRQRELDSLIETLPKILRGDNHLDALMKWIKEFIPNADDVGVKWNPARIADALEAAGYKNNEHVGQKPEWFNTRQRMGRYIVGQAINAMRIGMPPHPIADKFIDKYFAIPSDKRGVQVGS